MTLALIDFNHDRISFYEQPSFGIFLGSNMADGNHPFGGTKTTLAFAKINPLSSEETGID